MVDSCAPMNPAILLKRGESQALGQFIDFVTTPEASSIDVIAATDKGLCVIY
jgi:hypothetical protein